MLLSLNRAFIFAGTAGLLLLAADLIAWGGYQGFEPANQRASLLWIHAAVFGAAMIASFLAAFVVFTLRRRHLPSSKITAYMSFIFSLVSFFAVVAAFTAGGITASLIWLFFGAGLFAMISTAFPQNVDESFAPGK